MTFVFYSSGIFHVKVNATHIQQAEFWAASLWYKALPRWSGRSGQDKSYRLHVIHPALQALLRETFPERGIRILELGCGDGAFLDDRRGRELIDDGGAYLGIDISAELIENARKLYAGENIDFLHGNLTDPALAARMVNRQEFWDCALSIFALQEIPNLESVMWNLKRILPAGILIIFVTVHPEFAEWLTEEGRMKKADDHIGIHNREGIESGKITWRWAGYYPIVDEPHEPFYLPYFHRSIDDYRSLLEQSGFDVEKIVELPEKKHALPALVKQGISPFTPFETNLYWPRISESPSSIAICAWKEGKREQK